MPLLSDPALRRPKPFRLKSQMASNAAVDLGDSLKTKRALNRLGYPDAPDYGLTR